MVYQWKTVERVVPAQVVGGRIEELTDQYGEVTKESLLEDARPEGSVLHPLYEWRDDVAAEKYRLHQSSKILGDLVIVHVDHPDIKPDVPVRAFVSVSPGQERGSFRPIIAALSDKDTKERVFANAMADLRALEAKYRHLVDFAELLHTYLDETENG